MVCIALIPSRQALLLSKEAQKPQGTSLSLSSSRQNIPGVLCTAAEELRLAQDVIFSFPVTCSGGKWSIKQGLQLDDFSKAKLEATGKELVEEKALALECLNQK